MYSDAMRPQANHQGCLAWAHACFLYKPFCSHTPPHPIPPHRRNSSLAVVMQSDTWDLLCDAASSSHRQGVSYLVG